MQVMTEKCLGVTKKADESLPLMSKDSSEQQAAGRSGRPGPQQRLERMPSTVDSRRSRAGAGKPGRLRWPGWHTSPRTSARLALIAWVTAAALGCGIPVEPVAPANIELNVEADQVTVAWERPSSWLQLRRYEWRALAGDSAGKRLACPEAGDEEFCYLRPLRDPRIELPRPAGAEITVEVRAVYQRVQAHTGEFSPPRYSTTERVRGGSKWPPTTPRWHSNRGVDHPGARPIPTYPEHSGGTRDRNDVARHFVGE